jgi:putative acetyltransferase
MISIREEEAGDEAAIRRVNELAFEGPAEADLVDALRTRGATTLSLVALSDGIVAGHILFTPVDIVPASGGRTHRAVALGPMAVLPDRQRTGIGTLLVHRGIDMLRHERNDLVVVLGHPEYYPRFGFVPASARGIRCPYAAPDEAFMVLELRPGAGRGKEGTVRYQTEFDGA